MQGLEFDELKIDPGFVRKLDTDRPPHLLVKSFFDMGRAMGVNIVVEGIETLTQLEILRGKGCKIVQGLFHSPACAFTNMPTILENGRATVAA